MMRDQQFSAMSVLGVGCVTNLASHLGEVHDAIVTGCSVQPVALPIPCRDALGAVLPVTASDTLGREVPRLRRSSAISLFACEAAQRAMACANGLDPARMAVIFASTNGGVIYTRRFYKDVVELGNGSPIFFPETVYNSPASHVAALLGIDGEVLSLISDATAATDALRVASELLDHEEIDACLVVAAEEIDPITWEAYRRWNLTRTISESCGAVLTEGGVALLLARPNGSNPQITRVHPGGVYGEHRRLRSSLRQTLDEVCPEAAPDVVVSSASGTRFDRAEDHALAALWPNTRILKPKLATGEAFAASALLQMAIAFEHLRRGEGKSAVVSVTGWNGHVGAALIASASPKIGCLA